MGMTTSSLIDLLRTRFGNENQAERYRAELRSRRRRSGESLQFLYQDVCRVMSLAYPGPHSDLADIVGRDAFLDALNDHNIRVRILEREPRNIDEALSIACRLEAYSRSNPNDQMGGEPTDFKARKGRFVCRMALSDSDSMPEHIPNEINSSFMKKMDEILGTVREIKSREQPSQTNIMMDSFDGFSTNRQTNQNANVNSANMRTRQNPYRRKGRPDDSCRKCKQTGHWARECPLNQNQDLMTSQEGQSSAQSTLQTNVIATGRSKNEVYLCGKFNGQKITCQPDRGCDMSMIRSRLLPNLFEPTQHRLLADNHIAIPVVGETTISFSVSGKQFFVRLVVSEIMEDLILGIDWLRKYRCRWDFGKNLIEIDCCAVRLHGRLQ
jgi:hypothetical protein